MKVKEYNQMMGYLTRPSKSTDPKTVKLDMEKHTINMPNKYEPGPDIEEETASQKQLEKLAVQKNHGGKLWNSFVAANEVENKKKKKDIVKFINDKKDKPIQDIEHPNQVSFDPTTRLFSNKARTIAYQNYNDADEYNKKMGFKKTKYYPDEATPQQFGEMATRVEKMKQQQGSSTKMRDFVNTFGGEDKAIIKKKKIVTPVKIDFKPIVIPPPPAIRDPELVKIEDNFNKAVRDNEEEKRRNNSSGLAGLLGEIK